MARLKFINRDSLGWLIPVLLFGVFYGGFLWVNQMGTLSMIGALLCIGSLLGLGSSRRIRRLVAYHARPKTDERRAAFEATLLMERARRQAKKEGVPDLVAHLYFDYIQNFPDWFQHPGRDDDMQIIPPTVTVARKLPGNRITMTLNGKEYIFTFVQYVYSTPEGERGAEATLQISSPDQKLILLHLSTHHEREMKHWWPDEIEYITYSDWVNDFRHMREFIDEERKRVLHEDHLG